MGVLWHSTGAANKNIKRYVQPSPTDPNYDELIKVIGKNPNGNDWNTKQVDKGVHAFVGALADGTIAAVQTLPWYKRPWGCGKGTKGTLNDACLQFEICEDSLTDKAYFDKIYKEACELTAYLCQKYKIDPLGTFTYKGIVIPTILCHKDAATLKVGSNHGDIYHWFGKYGKTMDDVRNDVAILMGIKFTETSKNTYERGDKGAQVEHIQERLNAHGANIGVDGIFGAATEKAVKKFQTTHGLKSDGIVGPETLAHLEAEPVVEMPTVRPGDRGESVEKLQKALNKFGYNLKEDGIFGSGTRSAVENFQEGTGLVKDGIAGPKTWDMIERVTAVIITANSLNVRSGPGTTYSKLRTVKKNSRHFIIETQNTWGKLANKQSGWISLKYTKNV